MRSSHSKRTRLKRSQQRNPAVSLLGANVAYGPTSASAVHYPQASSDVKANDSHNRSYLCSAPPDLEWSSLARPPPSIADRCCTLRSGRPHARTLQYHGSLPRSSGLRVGTPGEVQSRARACRLECPGEWRVVRGSRTGLVLQS